MRVFSVHIILMVQQTSCSYQRKYRGATAAGVVTIESGDESILAAALAAAGPIATYVDASSTAFQVRMLSCTCMH